MKKISRRILTAALTATLAASLAFTLTACREDSSVEKDSAENSAATEELSTVRVAIMTGGASHWYAVIGEEAGIYKKHGIDLEITEFAAGVNTVDAVVNGQADFGNLADYACVNRLGNTQDNTNLVIVDRLSTSEGASNGGLYVSREITSLSDLAGKGFATMPGTVWDYWTGKTYEEAGIAEKDQKILNVDSPASAVAIMISGEADALWANGSDAAKLEDAGFKPLLTLDDMGLYTDAYYISTTDYVDANEALVEEYIAAQKETADWIYAHEDKAAAIFEKETGVEQELFHQNLAGTKLVTDFKQKTLDHINGVKDWAVGAGRFADFNILDFADLTPLKAVYPDSVTVKE